MGSFSVAYYTIAPISSSFTVPALIETSKENGPSGGAQTHGLVIPNHAIYQLSYTRILNIYK